MLLKVKINARFLVTTNIDLSDKFINGQIDAMTYFSINQNKVETIYVVFDDILAGQKRINANDIIARNNKLVQIKRERNQFT